VRDKVEDRGRIKRERESGSSRAIYFLTVSTGTCHFRFGPREKSAIFLSGGEKGGLNRLGDRKKVSLAKWYRRAEIDVLAGRRGETRKREGSCKEESSREEQGQEQV